jgi:predicted RNase H-like nuclease
LIVVGADATPAGWVCVALDDGRIEARVVGHDPAAIATAWPDAAVIGIDIPIGLPDKEARRADVQARRFVGARGSSVWRTPSRAILEARWSPGLGVSLQSHGMGRRIFGVERASDGRFREVHPEVTFAFLNERGPLAPKRTWAGLLQRQALLERAGVRPPAVLAPPDDVLDAAAAAWTARRIADGQAQTLPADPGPDEPVIWY